MASLLRRSTGIAALTALAVVGSPLIDTAGATTSPPKLTSQYPASGAYIVSGAETLHATYDQQISPKSTFTLYAVVNGSRGNPIGGNVTLSKSSSNGPTDTINYSAPSNYPLVSGRYEAVIKVDGVDSSGNDNPGSSSTTDFLFSVDTSAPGGSCDDTVATSSGNQTVRGPCAPAAINNQNDSAVPFTGTAAPGVTVEVDIRNDQDPTNSVLAKGTVVPSSSCSTATTCRWTVTIDASSLPDSSQLPNGSNYVWSSHTADAGNGASASVPTAQTIVKDTSPPSAPSSVQASFDDPNQPAMLHVTASDSDGSVTGYIVNVQDPEGHTLQQDVAQSGNLDTTFSVASLDDGSQSVSVAAKDAQGNVSQASPAFSSPEKIAGIAVDFAGSSLSTPSGTVSFPDAEAHVVQSPTAVQIHFTDAVQLSYTDQTSGTTHGSSVCIIDANNHCVVFDSSPTLSDDLRTMTVPVSTRLLDSASPYTVRVLTYDKNECPNYPALSWSCYTVGGKITTVGAEQPVTVQDGSGHAFQFSLDDVAPTVQFTGFSPLFITSKSVNDVNVTGTASSDAKTVQLLIRSSAGGSPMVVNVPVSSGSWSASGLSLAAVPDGRLTVTARATDAAGNTSGLVTLVPSPTLLAHPTTLTEHANHRIVVYGRWIHLYGRLVDANTGAPIPGATITLRPRFDNGSFGARMHATTTSRGYWGHWLEPVHNATYYATYAGTTSAPLHGAVTVHAARTRVRSRIVFTAPRYGAHIGAPVTVRGKVSPNKRGARVYLVRQVGRHKIVLGSVRINRYSRWAIRVTLPRGTDYVFARIGNTRGNLWNRTHLRKLVR